MAAQPHLYAHGFAWPEAPRWGHGALWISDAHNFRLARALPNGEAQTVLEVPGRPAGIDFDPAGDLIMATAIERKLFKVEVSAGHMTECADLSALAAGYLNDLVTDADGWTFVGDTGFVFGRDEPAPTGKILAHHREHGSRVVARDMFFPNGMSISEDGMTLFVSETFGQRVSAFDIGQDGRLENRRVHASLGGSPDGLCLDADGCLWAPLLFEGVFVRISPAGAVIDRIQFPGRSAIACTIAGEGGDTLFLCIANVDNSDRENPVRTGEVYAIDAPAPGAGWPRALR